MAAEDEQQRGRERISPTRRTVTQVAAIRMTVPALTAIWFTHVYFVEGHGGDIQQAGIDTWYEVVPRSRQGRHGSHHAFCVPGMVLGRRQGILRSTAAGSIQ